MYFRKVKRHFAFHGKSKKRFSGSSGRTWLVRPSSLDLLNEQGSGAFATWVLFLLQNRRSNYAYLLQVLHLPFAPSF